MRKLKFNWDNIQIVFATLTMIGAVISGLLLIGYILTTSKP